MKKINFLLFALISVNSWALDVTCPPDTLLIDFTPSSTQERMVVCQKKVDGKFVKHGAEIIYSKDGSIKSQKYYEMDILSTAQKTNILSTSVSDEKLETKCPTGFILVPKLPPYTTKDFCVAKYEMKNDGQNKAISMAANPPWVRIKRSVALLKCQEMGASYNFITNNQWQTIARNIAGLAKNWSNGIVASGQLNRGNTNGRQPLAATENDGIEAWSDQKRTHQLSNGNIIWDFSGNPSEFVLDDNESNITFVSDLERMHEKKSKCENNSAKPLYVQMEISQMNCSDILQVNYGAASETICGSSNQPPFCGMGNAHLVGPVGSATRGGSYGDNKGGGIFATSLSEWDSSPNQYIGFRCVKN